MQDLVLPILFAVGFLLFYVCVSGWLFSFNRLNNGQRILPLESGPTVSWGFFDLFLTVALLVVFSGTFLFIAMKIAGIDEFTEELQNSSEGFLINLWINVLASLSVFTIMAFSIYFRAGKGAIFGKGTETIFCDIRLGFIAFAMSIFPVISIQFLVTRIWPYHHPVIDTFTENVSLTLAIPTLLSAVICAPLFEEFTIRLLVQGWLCDWISGRLDGAEVLWGKWKRPKEAFFDSSDDNQFSQVNESQDVSTTQANFLDQDAEISNEDVHLSNSANPYFAPQTPTEPSQFMEAADPSPVLSPWWPLPIFISSALFAAMHIGHGPAPIPLFFLALVLGYLYQRTRRLTACLVVHFLVNAQAMCLLFLQIVFPELFTPH
ncbi:MAG: hypothetical protein COA78_07515 [Blastopirellula sp.]|nr:MAG: hypothetical protein COA78_07515 [Blastopirellula sp.]